MTIAQAHAQTQSILSAANCEKKEAQATARILLDEISGVAHAHLMRPEGVLSPAQKLRFDAAWSELQKGRPLAYVLATREFCGLRFTCDERALIPRPETELLVEAALEKLPSQNSLLKTYTIADLGTGSGCIAISLAHALPDAEIYATDISPAALELARENAVANGVDARIHFLSGIENDWAAPLKEYSLPCDLIVSNPPYIPREEIEILPCEIRDYEPHRALDGGSDGLDCYRQIASQCQTLLKPDGALMCELGAEQFSDVRAIFERQNWRVENLILDFAGIERILVAQLNR